MWRSRAAAGGPDGLAAAGHYAQYRRWTADAVDALLASGTLTADGIRFVNGMGTALGDTTG